MFSQVTKSIRDSLARTRQSVFGRVVTLLGQSEVTPETWDELEATLIQADVGAALAAELVEALKQRVSTAGIVRTEDFKTALRAELRARLLPPPPINLEAVPTVIMLVGVNGSGKTTTAAKLARYFQLQRRSVLLGAVDTFRAAAVEQLQVWGERLNIPVVAGVPNADPGAVAHDTVSAAKARQAQVVILDTAGRLQTKHNLMEELKKVRSVVGKVLPGAPHLTWLVLDAVTGQNALAQARGFKDAVGVTGVVLAKLDGSAKGGMVFAIGRELGLPVCFVGTGERFEDLAPFEPDKFLDGLLEE